MVQRLVFAIAIILLFNTCDFISPKATSLQNKIIDISEIDFTTVDDYPLFFNCKDLENNDIQLQCFGKEIISKLKQLVKLQNAEVPMNFVDTVKVDLLVGQDYRIKISRIQSSKSVQKFLPELDSILTASVSMLPSVVQPAIKNGIPVRSQFQLPVILTVANQ